MLKILNSITKIPILVINQITVLITMLAKILTSLLLSVSCSALLAGAPNNQEALGTGFVDDVILTQIGIETDEAGKPSVAFYGKTKDYVAKLGKLDVQISLSDEDEYVLAFVIITHL